MGNVKVGFGGLYEVGVTARSGGKSVKLMKAACDRIEELESSVRAARSETVAKLNEMIEYFEQMRHLALRDKDRASIQDAFAFEAEARCYEHARDMVIAWKATDAPEAKR